MSLQSGFEPCDQKSTCYSDVRVKRKEPRLRKLYVVDLPSHGDEVGSSSVPYFLAIEVLFRHLPMAPAAGSTSYS